MDYLHGGKTSVSIAWCIKRRMSAYKSHHILAECAADICWVARFLEKMPLGQNGPSHSHVQRKFLHFGKGPRVIHANKGIKISWYSHL